MKNLIVSLTKDEQAVLIVAVFLLLFAVVMGYAMVHDYRTYLDNHYKARYCFRDFVKRERYYVYLFLGLTVVMLIGLAVCLPIV